jgi:hypothetical protein
MEAALRKKRGFYILDCAPPATVILGPVPRICQRIEKPQRLQMPGTGPSMAKERLSFCICGYGYRAVYFLHPFSSSLTMSALPRTIEATSRPQERLVWQA